MRNGDTQLVETCEIPITEVMTPRVVVTALQQDMTIRQVLDEYPVLDFLGYQSSQNQLMTYKA